LLARTVPFLFCKINDWSPVCNEYFDRLVKFWTNGNKLQIAIWFDGHISSQGSIKTEWAQQLAIFAAGSRI
jgi:hypothetical protein